MYVHVHMGSREYVPYIYAYPRPMTMHTYEYERMYDIRYWCFFTVPEVPRRRIMRNIMYSLDSCKNSCIDFMGNPWAKAYD